MIANFIIVLTRFLSRANMYSSVLLLTLTLSVIGLVGCSPTQTAPTPLINGIMSQQTIEQLLSSQQLRHGQPSTALMKDTTVYVDSIVIMNYRHLGMSGDLSLNFFEKKLYVASFLPKDYKVYRRTLLRHLKVASPKRLIIQRGNTRIAESGGFGKRGELGRRVDWSDWPIATLAIEASKRDD